MPALLRSFTRVNLYAFVGEEQGDTRHSVFAQYLAVVTDPTEADRAGVYEGFMSFFLSCSIAFPIVTVTPSFLLP